MAGDATMSAPTAGTVNVRVPATTANLGPGFDCLGLALSLWNTATFTLAGDELTVMIAGEGAGSLPHDASNLVARAARRLYEHAGAAAPRGLQIACDVGIPLASGLGSSASAVVAGLLGANALLGEPASHADIIRLAAEFEGHPDNVAAALCGGLVVVVRSDDELITERIAMPPVTVALAVPELEYSTRAARAELPTYVALTDAVYNMGRATLVVEALRRGDLELLGKAMQDRLHQERRLQHVPGGQQAMAAAMAAGASAVAVSGSGPSLIAFVAELPVAAAVAAAMVSALEAAGVRARPLVLRSSAEGAVVSVESS
jgi:homoserine kinase